MSADDNSERYEGTTWVIFIDSFGGRDIEKMDWVSSNCDMGTVDCRPVYVTPTVLGQIYTGENPAENGMPSVSRYDQDPRLRPAQHTIPELAAMDDTFDNVLQFGLPFIVPPQVNEPTGDYWAYSGAMQQQNFAPAEAQPLLQVPGPAGDLEHAENLEMAFNLMVDHCQSIFATARTLAVAQDFDLVFVSIRTPDSYAHYHYSDGPDDSAQTWRDMLLEEIDHQVQFCSESGPVFVFGDHGARSMDDIFRVNRWLVEKGYLDVEIDHDYREKLIRDEIIELDEKAPGQTITASQIGVEVDEEESVAIGADPFSTGITLLDGASPLEVSDLMADFEGHPAVERAFLTEEEWEGDLIEECPQLYIQRKPGWFVSGNLSEELGGVEVTRDSVHDPIAAFGTNGGVDVPDTLETPAGLFDLIAEDYLKIDTEPPASEAAIGQAVDMSEQERQEMEAHLQDMGYM